MVRSFAHSANVATVVEMLKADPSVVIQRLDRSDAKGSIQTDTGRRLAIVSVRTMNALMRRGLLRMTHEARISDRAGSAIQWFALAEAVS